MTKETRKSWKTDSIAVCVHVPVPVSSALGLFTSKRKKWLRLKEVKAAIAAPRCQILEDDVALNLSQAINAVGSRDIFVGRIRKDLDAERIPHVGCFQMPS